MKQAIILFVLILSYTVYSLAKVHPSFKAGFIIPLSGHTAEFGVAIKNGIELARAEDPKAFKNCAFEFENSAYDEKLSVSAFKELTETDKVKLVYAFGVTVSEAIAGLAEENRVPLLANTTIPEVSIGKKYVLRYSNKDIRFAEALSDYLIKEGVKSVDIIQADHEFLNSLVKGISETSKGKFKVNILATVKPEDRELDFILPLIQKSEAKALGLFLFPGQVSSFARKIKPYVKDVLIFGSNTLASEIEVEASDKVLEGAVFANTRIEEDFRNKYLHRYGNTSQINAASEGYDLANLIAKNLCTKGGDLSSEAIVKILDSNRKVTNGAKGETQFRTTADGDRYWSSPVAVFRASEKGAVQVE